MTHAFGRLLMVGLGPGTDLLFLPSAVTSVAAVEPEAAMRRMASALARRHDIDVDIVDGIGESIPFPDNSFDSVHIGLVLCSVDNVDATLGRNPTSTGTRRQAGRPRACPRRRLDGSVSGPDRQAVVVAGIRMRAEPSNRRRHCRGRIRHRWVTPHSTHPGAASVHSPSARIRHRYRMSAGSPIRQSLSAVQLLLSLYLSVVHQLHVYPVWPNIPLGF